nr:hypothetical protein [Granulosicoccus antarcticus]
MAGIPVPALASALCYYDGYRTATLPANLLQAQRCCAMPLHRLPKVDWRRHSFGCHDP